VAYRDGAEPHGILSFPRLAQLPLSGDPKDEPGSGKSSSLLRREKRTSRGRYPGTGEFLI